MSESDDVAADTGDVRHSLEDDGYLFVTKTDGLSYCGGNACAVIDVWAEMVPSAPNTIDYFHVRNNSDKTVNVTLKWVNYVGGKGAYTTLNLAPRAIFDSGSVANLGLIGYYSSAASYQ